MKARAASTLRRIILNDSSEAYIARHPAFEPTIERVKSALLLNEQPSSDDGQVTASIIERVTGAAAFILWVSGVPVEVCGACWRESVSKTWWKNVTEELFFRMTEINNAFDLDSRYVEPPTTPWLGVIFFGADDNVTDQQMDQMVLLDQSVVWALMDTEK